MCIISSLNTWLLTKEINSFEEIAEHVSTKYELDNIQKVVFEKILSDNENLIKERIVDFNALFFKFNDMSLMEQSKKSKVLRDLLNPEISKLVQNNKAGAGYPKEVLEDMTKGIDLNSKDIAILDDLDLSMTNYLINTLNINESCIYLICSNEESYEIMEKSYNIRGGHLLKMEDVVNENPEKIFDVIIMNPPYGKRSSLAQKIIYHIFKFSLKIVVLAPPNTYKNFALLEYIQSIKRVNSNIFKDALIYNLCIGEINKSLGPFKNFPSLILSEKNLKLYEKIQFYNGNHSTSFKVEKDFLNCEKDWNKMFAFSYAIDNGGTDITPWNKKIDLTNYKEKHQGPTADIKFNFGNNFKSYYNNLKGNISFPRLINMHSPLERNNFSNWYYKAGKLANTIRYIISQCENITPKTQCYITYFPNLDWTRSWTDEEILEEIGLPKNFLEKS